MITLLIWLLVLVLVFGVIAWVIQSLPIPAPYSNVVLGILALIFILIVIAALLGDVSLPGRPLLR